MASRFMDRLAVDYRNLSEQYDGILNRCNEDNRDPTDDEAAILDGLRSEMTPLGDRLIELRETDERRWAAVRAMSDAPPAPETKNLPVVAVRSEAELYHPADASGGPRLSFFRDLMYA